MGPIPPVNTDATPEASNVGECWYVGWQSWSLRDETTREEVAKTQNAQPQAVMANKGIQADPIAAPASIIP
jgi:hypothetical protein